MNNNRVYKLARLFQQVCRTIDSKDKRINQCLWAYQEVPMPLRARKTKLLAFKETVFTMLMQELLGNKFKPGKPFNMWVYWRDIEKK